jgi:hypothetical protein
MTKRKWLPRKGAALLNKALSQTKQAKDDRLAILAVELGIAGAQVLQEEPFNFTRKQAALWLDKMLDRAKVNRGGTLAMMAVEEIDSGRQKQPD